MNGLWGLCSRPPPHTTLVFSATAFLRNRGGMARPSAFAYLSSASSSFMVFRSTGCLFHGAICASGFSTKSRRCIST